MSERRNLYLVVAARFVSRAGGSAAFFIGIWGVAAYVFKVTAAQLAWLSASNAVAGIVGSVAAGVLIDRYGPRKVLIVAELLSIPAVLGLALADTYPSMIAYSALFSLVGVPTFTAGASFAPYLAHGTKALEKANAWIEAAGSAGFVIGPAIGALVSQAFGIRWVFAVMATASVMAIVAIWPVRIAVARKAAGEVRHPFAEVRDGLAMAYETRGLRYLILLGTLTWLCFGAFSALEPLFYRDAVKVGVEWIGYINTLFGIGMVAGAWLLPRLPQRIVSVRGAAIAVGLTGLGSILYVGSTKLPLIALGGLAWGVLIGAVEPLLRTLIHVRAPHQYVGRIMGVVQYHRSAAELVPLGIAPSLAAVIGVQGTLIAGGVLAAALAFGSWRSASAIDAEGSPEALSCDDATLAVEPSA